VAVGAFATLVLGFMVMRAFGIGPMGSLQGKGVLGSREVLVVADFRGPDADPSLGPTVAEALRTDLGQSAAFTVLTRATLREDPGPDGTLAETVVAYDVAREIATREGAKAVLDGEVVRLGQGYVISARLVAALDGAELATFRQEASNDDALLPALGRLSRAVRERTGESLRSIRASTELERVTTPSLAALRRYVEGTRLADEEGESDRGLAMLQEAVELDTGFAMAWRKLATILSNEGRDRDRATRALETAYRHRDRLTEMERLITEGSYYYRGPAPDFDRALAVYTEMYRLDSTSTHALNNAAVIYGERRDDLRAEEMYRRVIALPRVFSGAYSNLVITQILNGRPPEVIDSTIAAFRARFPGNNDLWEAEWYGAYGAGDLERADSLSRAAFQQGRTFRQQSRGAGVTSQVALLRGRPLEGLQWATRGSEIQARVTPSRAAALNFALDSVEYAVFGQRDLQAARAFAERGMRRLPADAGPEDGIGWTRVAHLAALIGDPALARQALAGFERDEASLNPQPAARRAFYEGLVAMAGEQWDLAIGKLHQADAGFQIDERQAYAYLARAHDLAGRPDSARAYLERYVSTPDFVAVRDARWLPGVLRRLGEFYEESGEIDRAIEHYARFVNLWRDAEPGLQPQVREVSQRLERLRAGRG
jgi:eukaryotic-like serine/threonine-protein kinase